MHGPVVVDEGDCVVERVDVEADEDGAEDLLLVAVHGGGDVGEDGGPHPVAPRVPLHLDPAPVQQQLRWGGVMMRGVNGVCACVGNGSHVE